jgi:hypothetical protein
LTPVEWSEAARNWALVAAAVIGIAIALWRAVAADRQARAQLEQAAMGRREHVAAIFARAVGQLDDAKLHVRLGAIYSLREVMLAYPDLATPTRDLLTAYLKTIDYCDAAPPLDVEEIMTIILAHQGSR